MKRSLTLGVTALLALSLVSCAAPATNFSAPAPAADATAAAGGVGSPPLTAFLDELLGLDQSVEERAAHELQTRRDIEDLVATCMRDAGFDYMPEVTQPQFTEPGRTADGVSAADQDDREWVTMYGYGIVETPERAAGDPSSRPARAAGNDPNSVYVDSLTASEQKAYQLALHGEQPTDGEIESGWDLREAGCYGNATVEMRGADPRETPEFTPFFEAVDEFYAEALSWDGSGALESDWADCMGVSGHAGFTRQVDGLNEIAAEHQTLWADANAGDGSGSVEQHAPAFDRLQQLAEKERELALADLDCREQVDYRSRSIAIAVEAETRFMTDHAAAVSAIRAASEQQDR